MEKLGNILEKRVKEIRVLVDSFTEERVNYSGYINNAMLFAIYKKVSEVSKNCEEMYSGVSNSFSRDYIAEYGKRESELREVMRDLEEAGVFKEDEEKEGMRMGKGGIKIRKQWESAVDKCIIENTERMKHDIKEGLKRGIEMMEKCRKYAGENAEAVLEQMENRYLREAWREDEKRLREMMAKRVEGKEEWEKCGEMERLMMEMEWNARGLEEMWMRGKDVAREAFIHREKYREEDYRRLFRFTNSHRVVEMAIGETVWNKLPSKEYKLLFVNKGAEEIANALMKVFKKREGEISLKKYQYVALLFVMIDLGMTPHPANNSYEFLDYISKWLKVKMSNDTINRNKSSLVGTERRFGKEEELGKMGFTELEYEGMRNGYAIFFSLFNRVFEKSVEDGFASWVFEGEMVAWGEIKGLERLKLVKNSSKFGE